MGLIFSILYFQYIIEARNATKRHFIFPTSEKPILMKAYLLRAFSFYLVPHLTVRFITLVQTLSLVILGVRYYYIHYILYHYVQCCQLYWFNGQKLQPLSEYTFWYLVWKIRLLSQYKVVRVESNWNSFKIRSKFVWFDPKICDSLDSNGQEIFEKFDEN